MRPLSRLPRQDIWDNGRRHHQLMNAGSNHLMNAGSNANSTAKGSDIAFVILT